MAMVVSDAGKGISRGVSGGYRGDERKLTVRLRIVNLRSVVKTTKVRSSWDQSEGNLFTAQMATGVQAA